MTLFRLYIAGEMPASAQAVANLEAFCREHLPGHYTLEVVDVLQEPLRALSDGILFTPTLVRLAPPPVRKIVGDLSDGAAVLRALGQVEGANIREQARSHGDV